MKSLVAVAGAPPPIASVGGKGRSLFQLAEAGFNVPPAAVLTTSFFAPWTAATLRSGAWAELAAAYGAAATRTEARGAIASRAAAVRAHSAALALDATQCEALDAVRIDLDGGRLAVRSSSPEEDLAGASFAGLYETVLDVDAADLEQAVRRCYLSAVAPRVLLYKLAMGFENPAPAIAVVVQRMVASETAGVAFSLNPLTNDFDEALINAHRGLGDALVSGEVTPDTYVVAKTGGTLLEERPARPGDGCLTRHEIDELAAAATRIEALQGGPVDVEWAFADPVTATGGRLHILQARPVTTFVPLAPELQTAPGEPRMLYIDRALTDGITMSGPLSPLTTDYVERAVVLMLEYLFDVSDSADLLAGGICLRGSRIYFNASLYLHLMGNREAIVRQVRQANTLLADILDSVDIDRYRPHQPPDFLRPLKLLRRAPATLWRLRGVLAALAKPIVSPRRFRAGYARAQADYDRWLASPIDPEQPFDEFVTLALTEFGRVTLAATAPSVVCFVYGGTDAVKGAIDPADPRQVELADAICRGYPEDLVVQMGVAMFDLARSLPASAYGDVDELARRVEGRDAPQAFLDGWDGFMARFGCRGPLEMELANPKYGEDPRLALGQMASMAGGSDGFDPRAVQARLVAERERAFDELSGMLPRRRRRKLATAYRTILAHYDSREMIKHHLTQANERIRRRVLDIAEQLVANGRLARREDVFELSIEDIRRAVDDPNHDLEARVAANGAFYRQLKRQVRHFPHVIDSRGRILRPARRDDASTRLTGAPISPGVARGRATLLNEPHEKPVEPGDIIVAVTTDPGWTPLFINAGAVVLEIGGELQHGALVAREFGKPCVAGIADVMNRIPDGRMIEVDGAAGTVRIVEDDP